MNDEIREDASLRKRTEGIKRALQMNDLNPRGFPGIFDRRGGRPLPELEAAVRVDLGAVIGRA